MANFKTALAMENEIFKATDFNFGYDSIISNIATAMKAVLSGSNGNYVIGGKVTPYGSGGMNVSIAPIYGFCDSTGVCVAEGDITEPVSFEEADSELDRIDIIEICGAETGYDSQSRKFIDPSTATETTQTVNTKKKIALSVVVKKGSNGSEAAPAVDNGYVKLAEVRIPAGTNNITSDLIKNIDARKYGVDNTDWTTNKASTFNPSYLAEIFHTFLVQHNEDGSHKNAVIKAANIDFGTESTQVKGTVIPTGQSLSVHGVDFTSGESLTSLIMNLADNTNALYEYANDILSRYSFLEEYPVAASTENVDIEAGGEMTIDGIPCTIGQLVFLKDQTDAKENGFYEVQSGAWNRYAEYTTANASAFLHKFVFVKAGTANKGKVFYLKGDRAAIGTDELVFMESKLSPFALPFSAVVRDERGRAKMAEPEENDDIATKHYADSQMESLDISIGRGVRDLWIPRSRWLRFDFTDENHKSLVIDAGTFLRLDSTHVFRAITKTKVDLSKYVTLAGKDYYVYLVPDGEGTKIVASMSKIAPSDVSEDYTAGNTRKIGQFHTECADIPAGTTMRHKDSTAITTKEPMLIIPYLDAEDSDFKEFYTKTPTDITTGSKFNTFTVPHPLAGWKAGDILPESVFCTGFMPLSSADGMFYVKELDVAIDIYLQSGTGSLTKSAFGAATTRNRQQVNHTDDMLAVGKQLLSDAEFTLGAMGSNEQTAIKGTSESSIVTTGGHVDTKERRMVSARGGEDFCGGISQWLRDVSANGSSDWSDYAGGVQFGQTYGSSYAMLAGGDWRHSSYCGSRARIGSNSRADVSTYVGGRGSSRIKNGINGN